MRIVEINGKMNMQPIIRSSHPEAGVWTKNPVLVKVGNRYTPTFRNIKDHTGSFQSAFYRVP